MTGCLSIEHFPVLYKASRAFAVSSCVMTLLTSSANSTTACAFVHNRPPLMRISHRRSSYDFSCDIQLPASTPFTCLFSDSQGVSCINWHLPCRSVTHSTHLRFVSFLRLSGVLHPNFLQSRRTQRHDNSLIVELIRCKF